MNLRNNMDNEKTLKELTEEFVETFIPSKDVRNYLHKIQHVFSDNDKANIIANHLYFNDEEKITYLKALSASIEDGSLKSRIKAEIKERQGQIDKGEYPYTFSNGPLFDQIFIPHDFRHSDIVRISDHKVSNNDLCGIILGFTDEDYEFQKKLIGDYSDVQLRVETPSELTERDRFPHRHVNPIYLQRVKMTKDDKRWACFQNLLDAYERENPKMIK